MAEDTIREEEGTNKKNVEFDERVFLKNQEKGSSNDILKGNQRRVFVDLLKEWIENNHKEFSGFENFHLVFSHPEDYVLVMDKSIHLAIEKKLKKLHLDFSDPSWNEEKFEIHQTFLQLPLYEGNFEKLESLKLYSCNLQLISGLKSFSALKNISLGWIGLTSCSINKLLINCPVLEVLSLKKCWKLSSFEINAPNLTNLVIDKCFPPTSDVITVNAPKLKSFKYCGEVRTIFVFDKRCELEEAELDFGVEDTFIEVGDMLCQLLFDISSVKTLTVCSFMLQVLPSGEEPLSMKPGLDVRHLILKTSLNESDFWGITFLLESCPNLDLLTVDLLPAETLPGYDSPFSIKEHAFIGEMSYMWKPVSKGTKNLSTIVVKGFKGTPNELIVLRYFLKNGKSLLTVQIVIPTEENDVLRAKYKQKLRSLLEFRRSPNQRLEVVYR